MLFESNEESYRRLRCYERVRYISLKYLPVWTYSLMLSRTSFSTSCGSSTRTSGRCFALHLITVTYNNKSLNIEHRTSIFLRTRQSLPRIFALMLPSQFFNINFIFSSLSINVLGFVTIYKHRSICLCL